MLAASCGPWQETQVRNFMVEWQYIKKEETWFCLQMSGFIYGSVQL